MRADGKKRNPQSKSRTQLVEADGRPFGGVAVQDGEGRWWTSDVSVVIPPNVTITPQNVKCYMDHPREVFEVPDRVLPCRSPRSPRNTDGSTRNPTRRPTSTCRTRQLCPCWFCVSRQTVTNLSTQFV